MTSLISRFTLKDGYIHIKVTDEFLAFANLDFIHDDGEKTIKKGYTNIDFNKIRILKNKHSIPFYQYSLMVLGINNYYKSDKSNTEIYLDLNKLKSLLCKNLHSYNNTNLFKFKVLDKAVKEINEKTDINISYTAVKAADNKTIIGFNFTIQQNEIKQIIVNDIQEIKKETEITLNPSLDTTLVVYPMLVQELINIGVVAKKAVSMHKQDEQRLKAIFDEVQSKYADKKNDEKSRLVVSMFNNGVYPNFISPAEKSEQEQQIKIKQIEIKNQEQQYLQQEKQKLEKEIIKQNNREIFENEIAKENSQLSQIWKAITKAVELNIPTSQVRTWFNPAIAKIEANTLNIVLPNRFKLDFFKNNLLRYVNQALYNINVNINVKVSL